MDDWSNLPSRQAVSEPAPNHQSTMTITNALLPDSPGRVKRPQPGADHPRPRSTAPDPAGLARQPGNQSGAEPQNPNNHGTHRLSGITTDVQAQKFFTRPLDNTRPFMDG